MRYNYEKDEYEESKSEILAKRIKHDFVDDKAKDRRWCSNRWLIRCFGDRYLGGK